MKGCRGGEGLALPALPALGRSPSNKAIQVLHRLYRDVVFWKVIQGSVRGLMRRLYAKMM